MAELLDRPSTTFNSETAREAAARSLEVKRQNAQELANLRTLLTSKPIELPKAPATPPEAQEPVKSQSNAERAAEREVMSQLALTEEQVTLARKILNDDKACYCEECKRGGINVKERSSLLREVKGLCELRLDLLGIARPGLTKPTAKSTPRQRIPEPVLVSPCGPDTPTASVLLGEPEPGTPQVL
jgi:hypothetical protein